jgi:hypothetical protein
LFADKIKLGSQEIVLLRKPVQVADRPQLVGAFGQIKRPLRSLDLDLQIDNPLTTALKTLKALVDIVNHLPLRLALDQARLAVDTPGPSDVGFDGEGREDRDIGGDSGGPVLHARWIVVQEVVVVDAHRREVLANGRLKTRSRYLDGPCCSQEVLSLGQSLLLPRIEIVNFHRRFEGVNQRPGDGWHTHEASQGTASVGGIGLGLRQRGAGTGQIRLGLRQVQGPDIAESQASFLVAHSLGFQFQAVLVDAGLPLGPENAVIGLSHLQENRLPLIQQQLRSLLDCICRGLLVGDLRKRTGCRCIKRDRKLVAGVITAA